MTGQALVQASVQISIKGESGYASKVGFKGPNKDRPAATPKAAILEAIAELVTIAACSGFGPEAANTADKAMIDFTRKK